MCLAAADGGIPEDNALTPFKSPYQGFLSGPRSRMEILRLAKAIKPRVLLRWGSDMESLF